jgi:tetratricopeptide (TPR) repeat protein
VAANVPWDQRGEWFARAVASYEAAIDLARYGDIAGLSLIQDASREMWPDVPARVRRALLVASYRAGLLRVAEFRVRDVSRAIEHLRVVASEVNLYHPAWYYLGEAYALGGLFDRAEGAWREGWRRAPDKSSLQILLDRLPVDRVHYYQKHRDWAHVLTELARLPEGAMPDAERLTIEGDARQALGDSAAARDCWEGALTADSLAIGVRQRLRRLTTDRVL